jgi:hypothetical protein
MGVSVFWLPAARWAVGGGRWAVGLELAGDAFSAVRLHADHGDVAEEIAAFVPGFRDPVS